MPSIRLVTSILPARWSRPLLCMRIQFVRDGLLLAFGLIDDGPTSTLSSRSAFYKADCQRTRPAAVQASRSAASGSYVPAWCTRSLL